MWCLKVLLVDGDREFLAQAEKTLAQDRYSVTAVSDFEQAAAYLQRVKGKSIILSELEVGKRSGLDFLHDTLQQFPHIPFTFLSHSPPLESVIEALKHGAYDFLRKPVDPGILSHSVARSIEKLNMSIESERIEREGSERLSRLQADLKQSKLLVDYKGFLISMVGHDFKSIFTVLEGYLHVLKERCTSCPYPATEQTLEQVGRTLTRLRTMANTLLDYEAAKKGNLHIVPKEFELNNVLKECVSFYRPYAEQKRISLSLEKNLPHLKAKGDPGRVLQILDNLVYNAIKFTPSDGEIRIGARAEDGRFATAWVQDTGLGIPKSLIDNIFSEKQVVTGKDASARIGLGLNICKRLVEVQDGKIWLESGPGKGTTVFFSLPA